MVVTVIRPASPARLAALVPKPRLNLTRFHGVFAPNFKYRTRIVPRQARGRVDRDKPLAPMSWAQRLKQWVFAIDIETRSDCDNHLLLMRCYWLLLAECREKRC